MAALGSEIEKGFAAASLTATGTPNIQVRFRDSRLNVLNLEPAKPTDTLNLQNSLRLLISDQPEGSTRRVGLILADQFQPRPSLFGLMFDEDFIGEDPPREGCAIFLDAIHTDRAGATDPAAYGREVRFTTMHELGHTFNLWHQNAPTSYLSRSSETAYPEDLHHFNDDHKRYLRIDTPELRRYLEPAGAAFGDRAPGFPQGNDPLSGANDPARGTLGELTIQGPSKPFWYFEPIELEITLRNSGNRKSNWPDQLDPGYGAFAIWIEGPNGERRRYRTIKHFMETSARLHLDAGQSFTRDISLFGESGGYTFRDTGIHRVWVTYAASPRRRLRSNTLELELLPQAPQRAPFRRLHAALTRPRVASLLYYRSGALLAKDRGAIDYVLRSFAKSTAGAGLHYALGRRLGDRIVRDPARRQPHMRAAIHHLAHCADSTSLNAHRRHKAAKLLARIQELS